MLSNKKYIKRLFFRNKAQNQNNLYTKAGIANLIRNFAKKLFFFDKKQEISILWVKLCLSGLFIFQIFIDSQYKKSKKDLLWVT
jgi:hypothetical protein